MSEHDHLPAIPEGDEPIPNPGLPPHQWRPTDVDPRAEKRAERQVAAMFGVAGYFFIAYGCEPAPLLLGFVLGPRLEENLISAMLMGGGDPMIFVNRPISLGLFLAALALLMLILLPSFRRTREEVL